MTTRPSEGDTIGTIEKARRARTAPEPPRREVGDVAPTRLSTPSQPSRRASGRLAALLLAAALLVPSVASSAPPQDFERQLVLGGLSQPIGMTFLPDGRLLIIRKSGQILIGDPSSPPPMATSSYMQLTNVNSGQERGLIDITIDPDFESNGRFYLYYTPDSPERARISAFTHIEGAGGLFSTGNPSSEEVLWEDVEGYVSCCHYGGGLDFGPDGKLYLTTGDKFDGLKAQDLSLLAGKLIRINSDGSIPPDNFGVTADGVGGTIHDSIYSYGLRNPFRARWDLPTGRLFIGEVGGNAQSKSTEDLHLGEPGVNFGWPLCEGPCGNPDFPMCSCAQHDDPLFYYPHAGQGASITAGVVYRGQNFPTDPYRGAFFYGDYAREWIRYLTFDPFDPETVTGDFAFEPDAGPVVAIEEGPDGALYWLTIAGSDSNPAVGELRRFVFVGDAVPVVTQAEAVTPTAGLAPLSVDFEGAATDDLGPLDYTWLFGDGMQAPGPDASHTYTANGVYQARLEVTDGTNVTTSETIQIEVGTPPDVSIVQPPDDNTLFQFGDTISFVGDATDPDGTLTPDDYEWFCDFVRPTTRHPAFGPQSGNTSIDFTIPVQGQGFSGPVFYECTLTVTDSDGLQSTAKRRIYPDKVDLTFESVPPGLTLFFDGIPESTPFVKDTLKNFEHPITSPPTRCVDGDEYAFQSWSDGGAAQHTITVPQADTTYTATYAPTGQECTLPGEGLVLRLRGSDGVVSDSVGVATWEDQSGRDNDLMVTTGDPQLVPGGFNGHDVVSFDGNDDGMGRNGLSGFPLGNADRSVFMVVRYDSRGWGGFAYGTSSCNQAFGLGVTNNSVSGVGQLMLQGWCSSSDFPSTQDGTGAGWLSHSVVLNGNQFTHYADGVVIGQNFHAFETTGDKLRLGVELNDGTEIDMEVAEILVYDRAVTEGERLQIEEYFTSRYFDGVPANTPPTAANDSASVNLPGGSAEINLLANDSDPDGTVDPGSVVVVDPPMSGSLSAPDPATGAITYTHDGSTAVTDLFTYTVMDDMGAVSNVANVFVTVGSAGCTLPTDGLVVHLETDIGLSLTGSTVDAWLDQSGNGNDLTAAGDPTLVPGSLNGRDVVRFDGIDDKLERVGSLAGMPAGNGDRSAFAVVNYRSGGYGGIGYGSPNCNQTFGLSVNPAGTLMLQGWCSDFVSGSPGTGEGWISQSVVYGADAFRHFKDGVEIDAGSHAFATNPVRLVMGAEIDSNPHLDMDVAAFLFYDRAVTEQERQLIDAYLRNRYFGGECAETNEPPQAVDDSAEVSSGEIVDIDVTANDTDSDGVINPATVTIVDTPVNGAITAVDPVSGVVSYVAGTGMDDSFTYTVEDEVGAVSAPATVSIAVTAACSDGKDNDGDGLIDLADPHCTGPDDLREQAPACGLGFELVVLLPVLGALRRLRKAAAAR